MSVISAVLVLISHINIMLVSAPKSAKIIGMCGKKVKCTFLLPPFFYKLIWIPLPIIRQV